MYKITATHDAVKISNMGIEIRCERAGHRPAGDYRYIIPLEYIIKQKYDVDAMKISVWVRDMPDIPENIHLVNTTLEQL